MDEHTHLLPDLRASHDSVLDAFAGLSDAELERRATGGEWNAWEIAYHLFDIERWYLAKVCEAASSSRAEALARFVSAWARLREDTVTIAAAIAVDELDVPGRLSGMPNLSPRTLLSWIAEHDREHAHQALEASGRGGPLLHITERTTWRASSALGEYRAKSFASEGFIHLSTAAQVIAVASRFYRGRTNLVLLVIDPERLMAPVRWEESEPGQRFPHVYGPIPTNAVMSVLDFPPNADGTFSLPSAITEST